MSAVPQERAWADDAAMAARIAAGDTEAFELLLRRHNRRLYRLARATLKDDAEAEDALQEAYLGAFQSIGRFRAESSLATWLSRLVLHECLGRLRRAGRRAGIAPLVSVDADEHTERMAMSREGPDDSPPERVERAQMRALLERQLDALPRDFRIVFVLRGVEEMDVREVAHCLDIPEATVRSRFFRARGLLREALARELDLAEHDVFAFDGRRCDRIVSAVLARLARAREATPDRVDRQAGDGGPPR